MSIQTHIINMPPDRGRASKACTTCRKQKTRCYESGNNGGVCLRCQRLNLPCSLDVTPASRNGDRSMERDNHSISYDDRLMRLERTVERLVERLGDESEDPTPSHMASNQFATHHSIRKDNPAIESPSAVPSKPVDANHQISTGPSAGPVFVIRDVASEVGMGHHDQRIMDSPLRAVSEDVIIKGLLTVKDATSLLKLFHEHYGRWVSFNEMPIDTLLAEVRRSPLLLCACCLIAIRHTTEELASVLAPRLFQEAKSLFSTALLVVPQTFEFFQAAVILSMWSTTIGQVLLSIDSWLSSGFALQHSFASDMFMPITHQESPHLSSHDLDRWCVWNHLCLVHLHYSVGTKRKPLLERAQIAKCRQVLDSDHATNFESRIVAEVHLYWIIYESCSRDSVDLPETQLTLHAWKQEWKFLFDQPRSQFLQMGFHFAQLLAFDQSLKSRSAAVRESLLSEMVRLSAAILNLAMETADARTRHLSDHIYHVITFAAVTLCRLLHMYEHQLSSSHDILKLDQLILALVSWLYSIGLTCHVAHTLGDVVAAFHKKLRPDARPTPSQEELELWGQPDFAHFFPDLLGTEIYDGTDYALLPDWEPFTISPST